MAEYFVGVDNGGTVMKAAVFDAEGNLLGRGSCTCSVEMPKPGFTERDMEQLWLDTAGSIREALGQAGILNTEVSAVVCTGHGKGLYLWGKDNKPARPGIVSTDTRAEEFIARWNRDGTAERAHSRTLQ